MTTSTAVPAKFQAPFATSAAGAYIRSIPYASQIGIQDGAASIVDGFPPLSFIDANAGGAGPFGQDFNGLLYQITSWNRWQACGAQVPYDSAFATAIGGYPKGAFLRSTVTDGLYWISTVENNASDPDAGGANWIAATLRKSNAGLVAAGADDLTNITPKALRDSLVVTASTPTPVGIPGIADYSLIQPNGWIEKLGDYYVSGVSGEPAVRITFGTPFPTGIINVQMTPYCPARTNGPDIWVQEVRLERSATGFTAQAQASSSGNNFYGFSWRAIGN